MILETKQDKSKGCQVTNAIKFEDFVILKNKNKTFKLTLENEGFTVYQEEADKSWTKVTKSNDNSIEYLKKQEQDHTAQLNQLKERLALEQSKTANLVSLMKHIQEQMHKHTSQLKQLSLQLQQNVHQEEESTTPVVQEEQQVNVVEEVKQQVQQVNTLQSEQQTEVVEETKQEVTSQQTEVVEETKQDNVQNTPGIKTDINKTFAIKGQTSDQDFILLQCKEAFSIDTLPSKIKCRHIRQFFDLTVVDMNVEQRQLMVKPDLKLNNKQSIFVLESN